jgi:hypothetical protein
MTLECKQKRRWISRTGFVFFLVDILAVFLVILVLTISTETETNFEARFYRIKPGMTKAEALHLMGCPPGEYNHANVDMRYGRNLCCESGIELLRWNDDRNTYYLIVKNGAVDKCEIHEDSYGEPSIWSKIKRYWNRLSTY